MTLTLISTLLLQTADEIVARLEAKAAAARGLELRARLISDSTYGDERVERACAESRIEVSDAPSLWWEGWAVWIGPERKASALVRNLALYTREEAVFWHQYASVWARDLLAIPFPRMCGALPRRRSATSHRTTSRSATGRGRS